MLEFVQHFKKSWLNASFVTLNNKYRPCIESSSLHTGLPRKYVQRFRSNNSKIWTSLCHNIIQITVA